MKKISIIIPVCSHPNPRNKQHYAHPFLISALDSIIHNKYENYEILIGIDGYRPRVKSFIDWWINYNKIVSNKVKIYTLPYTGTYGNYQRNFLIRKARGDLICFLDQDDFLRDEALYLINKFSTLYDERPLIFKIAIYMYGNHTRPLNKPDILWKNSNKTIAKGSIAGHMFVIPNKKKYISLWPLYEYESDFYFIKETIKLFEKNGLKPLWSDTIISELRPWSKFKKNPKPKTQKIKNFSLFKKISMNIKSFKRKVYFNLYHLLKKCDV